MIAKLPLKGKDDAEQLISSMVTRLVAEVLETEEKYEKNASPISISLPVWSERLNHVGAQEHLSSWIGELKKRIPSATLRAYPRLAWCPFHSDKARFRGLLTSENARNSIADALLQAQDDEFLLSGKQIHDMKMIPRCQRVELARSLVTAIQEELPALLSLPDSADPTSAVGAQLLLQLEMSSLIQFRVEKEPQWLELFRRLTLLITHEIWNARFDSGLAQEDVAPQVIKQVMKYLDKNPVSEDLCIYKESAVTTNGVTEEEVKAAASVGGIRSNYESGYRSELFKRWLPGERLPDSGQGCKIEVKRQQHSSCWGGHFSSCSLRTAELKEVVSTDCDFVFKVEELKCGYQPKPYDKDGQFWFGIADGVNVIHSALRSALRNKEVGLIAICGETSAAKSQHVLGLIYENLRDRNSTFRAATDLVANFDKDKAETFLEIPTNGYEYSHLITLEEPIEDYLFRYRNGSEPLDPSLTAALGVHYTPRDLLLDFLMPDPRDVLSDKKLTPLARALQLDALRQKPTMVLVGESRNEADLKEVVRFAATGHQIYTTFHAGSLQEGLGKILKAWEARASSDRGEVATRIHAVIHLRGDSIRGKGYALPSVWVGTERSLDGLVKDGLRSVVPQRTQASEESAVLGRMYFAERLCDLLAKRLRDLRSSSWSEEEIKSLVKGIQYQAIGWDLDER